MTEPAPSAQGKPVVVPEARFAATPLAGQDDLNGLAVKVIGLKHEPALRLPAA
jgi:hypothetical protein